MVRDNCMKRITLDEIELKYELRSYEDLYKKVIELYDAGKLKPVKASGKNGKKPALYKDYWIVEEKKEYSEYLGELYYSYVPAISTEYYLKNLDKYEEDRKWLLLLNKYLKEHTEDLKQPQSLNERSFEIWHREKFIKEEQGKKILKRCKIPMEMLNIYETTEPLAYYVNSKDTPQNLLIIENKDTFYSIRKCMIRRKADIFGKNIGTLIYGAGKVIWGSFRDYDLCVEPHMISDENSLYYFGDIDYEGILIYEKLASFFGEKYEIKPFVVAYERMVLEAEKIGFEEMPEMKEGQNKNITDKFFSYFSMDIINKMRTILQEGKYIPQEILSEKMF